MTQVELAKKLGVGTTSVYNWCNGIKTPRMDKVDAMCDLFHCNSSDLIEEKETTETSADSVQGTIAYLPALLVCGQVVSEIVGSNLMQWLT